MNAFVDEVVKEAIGTSARKWALIVVALGAGAPGALWLAPRTLAAAAASTSAAGEPS